MQHSSVAPGFHRQGTFLPRVWAPGQKSLWLHEAEIFPPSMSDGDQTYCPAGMCDCISFCINKQWILIEYWKLIMKWTFQLANALDHLKAVGLIHADLKLDNVMLVNHDKEPYRVKLIDFGLACDVSAAKLGSYIQTRPYRWVTGSTFDLLEVYWQLYTKNINIPSLQLHTLCEGFYCSTSRSHSTPSCEKYRCLTVEIVFMFVCPPSGLQRLFWAFLSQRP